jgi:uncharacterized damage-inducible protein DinB
MSIQQIRMQTERIAAELRYLYDGPSWLGPSLKELIADVSEERARERPLADAHTIWELVLHITAWLGIARERLSATQIREVGPKENWPEVTGSWQDAVANLELEIDGLETAIRSFPEQRLEERAPATEPQTFYVLLHGVIEHSAYHAGQIALLKKAK